MDTRLLRGWSNLKSQLANVTLISLMILIFLCGLLPRPAFPQSSPLQPQERALSDVQLRWESSEFRFIGVQYLALPQDEIGGTEGGGAVVSKPTKTTGIDLWLLPNRDLKRATRAGYSREQRELGSEPTVVEWPYRDGGLGALLVKDTSIAMTASTCPKDHAALQNKLTVLLWKPIESKSQMEEQSLHIDVPPSEKMNCTFLKVSLIFEPRLGEGNFAVRPDGSALFSGPFFPIWKNRPTFTRLRMHASSSGQRFDCLRCSEAQDGATEISFSGFPPPIELTRTSGLGSGKRLVFANGSRFEKAIDDWHLSEEQTKTLKLFFEFAGGAVEKTAARLVEPWQFILRENALLEQLVAEQSGEIQLHSSFGKINPLLSEYHRAALFRALARSFLRASFDSALPAPTWRQMRTNETLARLVGEQWLHAGFPKLNRLRSLSDSLSFLPFFRAVQQGSAFLNNAVFLGAEERQSPLDFSLFHDAFAPLDGNALRERFLACAQENDVVAFENISKRLASGDDAPDELMRLLLSMKRKEGCLAVFEEGLIPATIARESLTVTGEDNGLIVRRETERLPALNEFLFGESSGGEREALRVEWRDTRNNKGVHVWTPEAGASPLYFPSPVESAQVVGLHTSLQTDKLQWPRPLRTVIQALAMNYDSRRADLTVKSQIQTTQSGDEWGRALTLGFRREYLKNNFDLQFSSRVASFFPQTQASLSLATTTRLEQSPPSFLAVTYGVDRRANSLLYPEGAGLQIWLRRPITLSALREVMRDPPQEWIFDSATGLAPRLTWSEQVSFGLGEDNIDVGLRSVPGWPGERFVTKEYVLVRSELRQTLGQNFNISVAKSLLFQHAVLYGAHVAAFDRVRAQQDVSVDARSAQSLVVGLRLFGALFGAKDQALTMEMARALDSPSRTTFGFSLGKAAN